MLPVAMIPSCTPSAASSTSTAVRPCNRDNTIIEFRVIEGAPASGGYHGEFGFDWLRVQEEVTTDNDEKDSYVDHDSGHDPQAGQLEAGYKDEDNDLLQQEAYNQMVGRDATGADVPTGGEYEKLSVVRDFTQAGYKYRHRSYFTTYLNLFPKNTKEPIPPTGFTAPPLPKKATLRLIRDVKDDQPKEVVIEYDRRYVKFSGCGGVVRKKKSDPPNSHLREFVITSPLGITGGSLGNDRVEIGRLTVECLTGIDVEQKLKVYAYPLPSAPSPERKLAGQLILGANGKVSRKSVKIALIQCKTKRETTSPSGRTSVSVLEGYFEQNELNALYYGFYQALVIPKIINSVWLNESKSVSLKISLSGTADFLKGGAYREDIYQYDAFGNVVGIDAECQLNSSGRNFAKEVERKVCQRFQGIQERLFFFAFDEPVSLGGGQILYGNADTVSWYDTTGGRNKWVMNFRPTVFVYKGRDDPTLPHEGFHGLTLCHTHRDSTPLGMKGYRYVFPKSSTTNIMAYNSCYTTWRWQWEQIRKNLTIRHDFARTTGPLTPADVTTDAPVWSG